MRTIVSFENPKVASRAFGVRVLLMSCDAEGPSARRLAEYGSRVDCEAEFHAALTALVDDPMGYDLFVMDCDHFGGIAAGERAVAALVGAGARMRIILISQEFDTPTYPLGRRTAVCLPSPTSDYYFRFGFDHVLRDRRMLHLS